jgi:iron complex transport system substrate-binding protein
MSSLFVSTDKPKTPLFPPLVRGDGRGVIIVLIFILWVEFLLPAHAQEPPQRIISLAPNVTEIIFELGAQEHLIGRTEFCLYPNAAQKIPSVGGYLNPDYEKIVDLQPDVIFIFPNADMERKLQGFGFRVFSIPDETIEEVLSGIRTVGKVLGLEQRANDIIKGIQDTLDQVSRLHGTIKRPSVLLVVGRENGSLKGLYAAGKNIYLGEIWKLCGGRSVFDDISIRYFNVSKEDLVTRNPDCILEFRIIPQEDRERKMAFLKSDWMELAVLDAVKEDRIYIFTDRFFLIPGPRISKIAISFSHVLERIIQ